MILRSFLILLLLSGTLLLGVPNAHSARGENEAQLESVKAELSQENERKRKLQERFDKIESELSGIKNRLTQVGRDMRENEDRLKSTQGRIEKLEERKAELTKNLEAERVSIVKLILMLGRIRKTPPEVMIARPDTPYHTAQSALLMENIIPSVKRDAQRLMSNLETLNQLTTDLKNEQEERKNQIDHWEKQREKLMVLVKEKEELYAEVDKDLKARQLSVNAISLKAKSLEDLIARIKAEEQQEIAARNRQGSSDVNPTKYLVRRIRQLSSLFPVLYVRPIARKMSTGPKATA